MKLKPTRGKPPIKFIVDHPTQSLKQYTAEIKKIPSNTVVTIIFLFDSLIVNKNTKLATNSKNKDHAGGFVRNTPLTLFNVSLIK